MNSINNNKNKPNISYMEPIKEDLNEFQPIFQPISPADDVTDVIEVMSADLKRKIAQLPLIEQMCIKAPSGTYHISFDPDTIYFKTDINVAHKIFAKPRYKTLDGDIFKMAFVETDDEIRFNRESYDSIDEILDMLQRYCQLDHTLAQWQDLSNPRWCLEKDFNISKQLNNFQRFDIRPYPLNTFYIEWSKFNGFCSVIMRTQENSECLLGISAYAIYPKREGFLINRKMYISIDDFIAKTRAIPYTRYKRAQPTPKAPPQQQIPASSASAALPIHQKV